MPPSSDLATGESCESLIDRDIQRIHELTDPDAAAAEALTVFGPIAEALQVYCRTRHHAPAEAERDFDRLVKLIAILDRPGVSPTWRDVAGYQIVRETRAILARATNGGVGWLTVYERLRGEFASAPLAEPRDHGVPRLREVVRHGDILKGRAKPVTPVAAEPAVATDEVAREPLQCSRRARLRPSRRLLLTKWGKPAANRDRTGCPAVVG